MQVHNKNVTIITLAVIAAIVMVFFVFDFKTDKSYVLRAPQEQEAGYVPYVLPEFSWCGISEELAGESLRRIRFNEKSLCDFYEGESYETVTNAKKSYGTKVDLRQKATEVKQKNSYHTAYSGDTVKVGSQEIEITSVDFTGAEFQVGEEKKKVELNSTVNVGGLDISPSFCCGETYRVDFGVGEYPCCESEYGKVLGEEEVIYENIEEPGDMIRKAKEETELDLSEEKRSGYKGVILPNNVAKDYPSTDFVILPFVAEPNGLCCGCMQIYNNLKWWGDYTESEVRDEIVTVVTEMNEKKSEFEEDPYTVTERDEKIMNFILKEINYIKQNKDYFREDMRVPKGDWINPDYVIEGYISLYCCENANLIRASFSVDFINAKTEKKFESVSYTPNNCFDLVNAPGRLMAEATVFGKQVTSAMKNIFQK